MAKVGKIIFGLILVAVVTAGCSKNVYTSKAKNNDCGCPNKKGMVGY